MKSKNINSMDVDPYCDPWHKLANAIIIQACRDFLDKRITTGQLKNFCEGEWFQLLSDVDGSYLFERLVRDNDSKRVKSGN